VDDIQRDLADKACDVSARQDGSHEARRAKAFTEPHRHYAIANGRRMGARALAL
jgi:hypothetical protein